VSWQVCIPLTLGIYILRDSSLDILVPLLSFVGIYSFQPHKEWRFVVYTIPGLTAVAAIGANWIWMRRNKTLVYRFLSLALIASTLAAFVVSLVILGISSLNYPGAVALNRVHALAHGSKHVISLHMDTLSCTTGITRFLEMPTPTSLSGVGNHSMWIYDKTEDPQMLLHPTFWERFDYALAERPEKVIGKWGILETVDGFAGVRVVNPGEQILSGVQTRSCDVTGQKRLLLRADCIAPNFFQWYEGAVELVRKYITRGYWIGVKMEPKIRIMKKLT
jgi:alpha-1,6-mannosyltransferase